MTDETCGATNRHDGEQYRCDLRRDHAGVHVDTFSGREWA